MIVPEDRIMENTYKLIIVDDESIICRGLASFHWSRLGFTVTGTATDGEECLRLMEQEPAHLIISDIQMPVMDGLTLAEKISTLYPSCKLVLLTGHKKFEYAQTALKYSVVDYLVKPIDLSELEALAHRVKALLDEESARHSREESLQNRLSQSIPYAVEKFWETAVLQPVADTDELEEKLNLLEISLPHPYFVCCILQFSNISRPDETAQVCQSLREFADSQNPDCIRIHFFRQEFTDFVLILNFNPPAHIANTYSYICQVVQALYDYLRRRHETLGSLSISAGNIYNSVTSCHASWQQALDTLSKKFFDTESTCFYAWQERSSFENILVEYPYDQESKLIDAILTGDRDASMEHLNGFHDTLYQKRRYLNQEQALNIYRQFLLMLNRRLSPCGIRLSDILEEEPPFMNFFSSCQNLPVLQKKMRQLISDVLRDTIAFNQSCNSSVHLAIQQALDYIHRHYAERVTLSLVADHVHLNASYFSLQFKNEVGKNFTDVLKEYRIEKAKELLRSPGYKIYEISTAVGYQNPNYFTDAFKLMTGMTPLEYRKKSC